MSDHTLNVEKGRQFDISRERRICQVCNSSSIEDEFHFILVCQRYNLLRKQFIKPYYWKNASTFKLVQLLNAENISTLRNLGKYIVQAMQLRTEYLSSL